ncbi:hypothetical protein PILCRDRAFT_417058 [Piloderma croceum F 1598]|uniref:Uncharacterized protein n=1 Tax=Piloderma croceum (strain F 1598) TaxID=765440 RepID=A0A0C3BC77_PILCF|nr:hypothetical protein PILCRDRAFT_417058 [Piloderma croceum F 1598]
MMVDANFPKVNTASCGPESKVFVFLSGDHGRIIVRCVESPKECRTHWRCSGDVAFGQRVSSQISGLCKPHQPILSPLSKVRRLGMVPLHLPSCKYITACIWERSVFEACNLSASKAHNNTILIGPKLQFTSFELEGNPKLRVPRNGTWMFLFSICRVGRGAFVPEAMSANLKLILQYFCIISNNCLSAMPFCQC